MPLSYRAGLTVLGSRPLKSRHWTAGGVSGGGTVKKLGLQVLGKLQSGFRYCAAAGEKLHGTGIGGEGPGCRQQERVPSSPRSLAVSVVPDRLSSVRPVGHSVTAYLAHVPWVCGRLG